MKKKTNCFDCKHVDLHDYIEPFYQYYCGLTNEILSSDTCDKHEYCKDFEGKIKTNNLEE